MHRETILYPECETPAARRGFDDASAGQHRDPGESGGCQGATHIIRTIACTDV